MASTQRHTSQDRLVSGNMDVEEPEKVWLGSPLEHGSWRGRRSHWRSHRILLCHVAVSQSVLKESEEILQDNLFNIFKLNFKNFKIIYVIFLN